jgi:hypothetical protein
MSRIKNTEEFKLVSNLKNEIEKMDYYSKIRNNMSFHNADNDVWEKALKHIQDTKNTFTIIEGYKTAADTRYLTGYVLLNYLGDKEFDKEEFEKLVIHTLKVLEDGAISLEKLFVKIVQCTGADLHIKSNRKYI